MARNNYANAMSEAYKSREEVPEPTGKIEVIEVENNVAPETKPEVDAKPLKAGLTVTKKKVRKGLQKSFYIKEDTYLKLKAIANENDKSISDTLQEILDQIL